MLTVFLALLCMSVSVWSSMAVEFTFELPDRDRQCFYEEVKQGTKGTLEYQVIKRYYKQLIAWMIQLASGWAFWFYLMRTK